jgi:hypothetical protein
VTPFVTVGSSFDAKPPLVCPRDGVKELWVCKTWEKPTIKKALIVATTDHFDGYVGYARKCH